jgi:hypothetical protein
MADSLDRRLDRRAPLAIGFVIVLAVLLLLTRCGTSDSTKVGAVANSAGPAEPAPAAVTLDNGADDSEPADQPPVEPATGDGSLTVDDEPLLPLAQAEGVGPNGDLTALSGKEAVAWDALVLTVPADEGFWLGTSSTDRVWVQLTGLPPESPYVVLPGDTVSFTARITPNGPEFARRVGVTQAEGAATLTAQRQHLAVPKRALNLNP